MSAITCHRLKGIRALHAGVPWALRRLQEARKLNLTVSDYIDEEQDVGLDAATSVMEVAQALMSLEILVRLFLCLANSVCCMLLRRRKLHWVSVCKAVVCIAYSTVPAVSQLRYVAAIGAGRALVIAGVLLQAFRTSGEFQLDQLCQPYIKKLLSAQPYLTALAAPARTLPCSAILQDFPLRHLELVLSGMTEDSLEELFQDISCCHTLEVLRIIADKQEVSREPFRLPSMHLQSLPCLKHIRLEDCLVVDELSLPADCSLFLDLLCCEDVGWLEHLSKFEAHATVLRLSMSSFEEWLPVILRFSKLQGLEVSLKGNSGLDLADLRHIPHVKLVVYDSDELSLTAGSWESLEVMHLGELELAISDVDSFVRDTKSFTVMSESWYGEPSRLLRKEIRAACSRLGKTCHVCKHHGDDFGMKFMYITLSTSQEVARRCPMHLNRDEPEDTPIYASSSLQHMLGQTRLEGLLAMRPLVSSEERRKELKVKL